jgi:hypothetical protein
MAKLNVSQIFKSAQAGIVKHGPEILTGLGIAGFLTAIGLAVKATPAAMNSVEKKKDELQVDKLKPIDTIKATWKHYIPTLAVVGASTACVIGASTVSAKRNAALVAACKFTETAFTEYKEKVVETIGERKEKTVNEAISKDRIEKNPVTEKNVVFTERGNTLCYDVPSDRYFRSDIEQLKKGVNELNRRMLHESYISLNEYYAEIGLHSTESGDILGWNTDKGLIDVYFSSELASDGTPCLAIGFNNPPVYGYDKLY